MDGRGNFWRDASPPIGISVGARDAPFGAQAAFERDRQKIRYAQLRILYVLPRGLIEGVSKE
jgi:hypothetical protein